MANRRPVRITAVWLSVAAGLLRLGIGVYQLAQPHVLTGVLGYSLGYDDGAYAGMPIRILDGAMPYRDFSHAHPPGLFYLLLPIALVGRLASTADAVALARVLTVVVT